LYFPSDRVNVAPTQMVPKQFLKALTREGLAAFFFYDWRTSPEKSRTPNSF